MAHIVKLTWKSLENQSKEQKAENAGGEISQSTDGSASVCAQKIKFSHRETCFLSMFSRNVCIYNKTALTNKKNYFFLTES